MMRQREILARLQEIAGALPREDGQTLLAFAEFLVARNAEGQTPAPLPPPKPGPGPEGESVVAAMKRLSAQYPMLDKAKLLDAASRLMGEHVLRGRKAPEVVADLEKLFDNHYQTLLQGEHRDP